jgi:3-deoxy-D-arabino-heptulosonate 7-phosphate (DAHP) synthase class II
MKFNKANWENIKSDLQKVLEKLTGLITFIESNVPHKMITYIHRLPTLLSYVSNSMYTISWSAFPMGGNVVTLLTLDGVVTRNKSSVRT